MLLLVFQGHDELDGGKQGSLHKLGLLLVLGGGLLVEGPLQVVRNPENACQSGDEVGLRLKFEARGRRREGGLQDAKHRGMRLDHTDKRLMVWIPGVVPCFVDLGRAFVRAKHGVESFVGDIDCAHVVQIRKVGSKLLVDLEEPAFTEQDARHGARQGHYSPMNAIAAESDKDHVDERARLEPRLLKTKACYFGRLYFGHLYFGC